MKSIAAELISKVAASSVSTKPSKASVKHDCVFCFPESEIIAINITNKELVRPAEQKCYVFVSFVSLDLFSTMFFIA